MDFEEQWKEQFYQAYLESIGKDKQPKPSIGILQALKKKIKWKS